MESVVFPAALSRSHLSNYKGGKSVVCVHWGQGVDCGYYSLCYLCTLNLKITILTESSLLLGEIYTAIYFNGHKGIYKEVLFGLEPKYSHI